MAYIITNGKNYLMSHREVTSKLYDAFRWNKISKANNVLKALPRNFRNKDFRVEYVQSDDGEIELLQNALFNLGSLRDVPSEIKLAASQIDFSSIVGLKNRIEMLKTEIVDRRDAE